MLTCTRCGAHASPVGLRGTVVWTRSHLGDASRPVLERSARSGSEICPACRADESKAAVDHRWRWWRRPRQARAP